MKLYFQICVLILFINHNSYSQTHGIARSFFAKNSTAKIKSILLYRSKVDKRNIRKPNPNLEEKKMYLERKEIYNAHDQLESDLTKNKHGFEIGSSTYHYNQNNKLEEIRRAYLIDSIYIKKKYLDNKIIIHTIQDDTIHDISIQYLQQDGKLKDWVFLDYKRDTTGRYQYEYDERGNEKCFILTNQLPESKRTYKKYYNQNNTLEREETYDYKETLIEEITIEEIQNSQYKDSDLKIIHTIQNHKLFGEPKIKTYKTETIKFIDKHNNTIKIYTNRYTGKNRNWSTTYLNIEYD